ncbi:MAG: NlpC/P60 family protein [Aestuariivirga sp.]
MTTLDQNELRQVTRTITSVLRDPVFDSPQTSQALRGELCRVFEERGDYAWVQLRRDGYIGYVESAALSKDVEVPTHWVCVPSTLIFPKPDLKSHPVLFLTMNAEVRVIAIEGNYSALAGGGYIFSDHLARVGQPHADFVAVAEQFLNVPYYWGGKSVHGIDCSGLVQIALQACDVLSPRDSGEQEKELGILINDHNNLRSGDLVFWPGHVGIMQSATQVIHANGHFMKVTSEPLADVVARSDKPISNIRRLSA